MGILLRKFNEFSRDFLIRTLVYIRRNRDIPCGWPKEKNIIFHPNTDQKIPRKKNKIVFLCRVIAKRRKYTIFKITQINKNYEKIINLLPRVFFFV